jgi:hypothetical protein
LHTNLNLPRTDFEIVDFVVSGVKDTYQWSAVSLKTQSLTRPTTVHLPLNFKTKFAYCN